MKLIVGLGNVGERYANTRHNLGFRVAEQLKHDLGIQRDWHFHRSITEEAELTHSAGREALIVRPLTMMNLSGHAVGALVRYYKLAPADVWVIYDDFELSFGTLRVRSGGSSGGHNGMKSIIDAIGQDFGRFRIGIANDKLRNPIPADKFVLAGFEAAEAKLVPQIVAGTAEMVADALSQGAVPDLTIDLLQK